MAARGTYLTSYCNQAHHLSDGKPYRHECRILPPAALHAEKRGDFEEAQRILAETPLQYSKARQGVPDKNLPAVETCRSRSYLKGTVLKSAKWNRPRQVVEIRKSDVILADCGRSGKHRVRSLPADVSIGAFFSEME